MLVSTCCYFSTTVGLPTQVEPGDRVRVPCDHCRLMETMLQRMHAHPDGKQVATMLETDTLDGQRVSKYGPDLDVPAPISCTQQRFQESCTPAFVRWLAVYNLDTSLP